MSNLGAYQWITTIAKKVGGPKLLVGWIFGGGAVTGGLAVGGGVALKNANKKRQQKMASAVVYTVTKEGSSNEGLLFKEGDQFKALESDGDAVLIEKLGDKKNPYFVSAEFLSTISDYKVSKK